MFIGVYGKNEQALFTSLGTYFVMETTEIF